MTTILLARHGESDWNVEGRWQGHEDRPLSERGRRQAETLAERLAGARLDAIYSSDLRRAADTAKAVAERKGLEVRTRTALREVDVGSWTGLSREGAAARFPDGYRRWLAGETGWDDGETYEAMGARILAELRAIAEEHPGGRVLVVSHGGSIRAVHAHAQGLSIPEYKRLRPVEPNAQLSAVVVDRDRITMAEPDELD